MHCAESSWVHPFQHEFMSIVTSLLLWILLMLHSDDVGVHHAESMTTNIVKLI